MPRRVSAEISGLLGGQGRLGPSDSDPVSWDVRWWLLGAGTGRPSEESPPSVASGSSRGPWREATAPPAAEGAGGGAAPQWRPAGLGRPWFLVGFLVGAGVRSRQQALRPESGFRGCPSVGWSSSASAEARSDWKAFPGYVLAVPRRPTQGGREGEPPGRRGCGARGWGRPRPWSPGCGIPGSLLTARKGAARSRLVQLTADRKMMIFK